MAGFERFRGHIADAPSRADRQFKRASYVRVGASRQLPRVESAPVGARKAPMRAALLIAVASPSLPGRAGNAVASTEPSTRWRVCGGGCSL